MTEKQNRIKWLRKCLRGPRTSRIAITAKRIAVKKLLRRVEDTLMGARINASKMAGKIGKPQFTASAEKRRC